MPFFTSVPKNLLQVCLSGQGLAVQLGAADWKKWLWLSGWTLPPPGGSLRLNKTLICQKNWESQGISEAELVINAPEEGM